MQFSIELSAIIGFGFGFVIWLAGLGFAVKQIRKDFDNYKIEKALELENFKSDLKEKTDKLTTNHDELAREVREELKTVNSTLSRIEGKLDK